MADSFDFLHAALSGASIAAVTFFGFIGKRFITKVDETAADLAKHKIEDVSKYATAEQLLLVHQRIDESRKSVEEGFKEVRMGIDGIKNILMNGVYK